ncbi:integrase [Lactobacillus taiwanensis]|uniref:tyrosine-type recombinase/integrase n=2 Tax=Lactobacillus taiwanensis TaxID=508451 RepID=UPI000B98D6BD|nr:tyrosine-type recombinase/integrase [Lactobacillus taiwanensis]OYR96269.1 integrase [Lactobacillus taiwanensis]OYS01341.1 integrase [Lactobacillus taiwanensis]OYS14030.1 integrase [Lactobacillus taiwanensis]OYS19579.1 integrase [Lactobacillus taiwanensis]OYS20599.1 integrase [Lactobacillus taiwanensis]
MLTDEIIENFLEDKRLEGRASGTIQEYCFRLTEVKQYLETGGIPVNSLDGNIIADFVRFLQRKGQKAQTIKNKLSTLSVFEKWALKEGLVTSTVVSPDYYPKSTEIKRIRRLSDTELRVFKSYLDTLQENVRAAFYLMMGTGCRVGEVAHLRVSDVSLRGKSVYVDIKDAKWGSDRCIPITDKKAAQIVWRYCESVEIDTHPLFRLSKRTIQGYATTFAQKTGITFRCHLLRHTYAALLTEQGVPMPTIQYLLGHKNLGMTAHYTQSAITDLKDLTPEI